MHLEEQPHTCAQMHKSHKHTNDAGEARAQQERKKSCENLTFLETRVYRGYLAGEYWMHIYSFVLGF